MGSSVRPAARTQSLARCSYTLVSNVIGVFALYPSHRLLCGLDCLDAEIVVTAFLLWKTYCPCCPFGPSRSHVRHSALMTRTMFVSEGCPRLLRSCTVTKPRTRLTHCVLSGGPANARPSRKRHVPSPRHQLCATPPVRPWCSAKRVAVAVVQMQQVRRLRSMERCRSGER